MTKQELLIKELKVALLGYWKDGDVPCNSTILYAKHVLIKHGIISDKTP